MTKIELKLSKKKRSGSGEQQIYMRLSVDRTHIFRVKTGLYVPSERWDQKSQRVILPRMRTVGNLPLIRLQEKLDSMLNGIIEKTNTTPIYNINKVWLQEIISSFNGETTATDTSKANTDDSSDISVILGKFIEARCNSHRRADHFHCMERMIKRFCLYAAVPYTLDDFSAENMKQFETFLSVEHTFFNEKGECIKHKAVYEVEPCKKVPKQRGINAINEVLRRFRTFYNWAVSNGYTKNNPFGKYQIPGCVYGTPLYMTSEERDKLFGFDFSNRPGLAVQRDIFVFQSNVGMRAGDMMELTRKNVVDGAIEYVANKTVHSKGTTIRVPLTAQAQTILDRYDSYKGIELLPFTEIQAYNRSIKEMLKLAGIDRIVTWLNPTTREEEQRPLYEVASSHMARRNFIGNLYNKTPDPNVIGSMTGHTEGSRAFARYRKVDESLKRSLVDLL